MNQLPKRIRRRIDLASQEVAACARIAGLRGVLAFLGRIVCGYPKELSVKPTGLQRPVSIRLHTSDAMVCEEVLLSEDYSFALDSQPHVIVDAGANCGMTSVFYASRYPEAMILAIEPDPANFVALVENAQTYPNIKPIRAALWAEDGEVEVFAPFPKFEKWGKWGCRVRSGHGCRAISVPTLMREFHVESIDILKVDIEGAEIEVFSGCDWIDRVNLPAIELHDRARPGCTDLLDSICRSRAKVQKQYVTFYSKARDPSSSHLIAELSRK